jgi:membrane protease YdiL (CAAX protease family)
MENAFLETIAEVLVTVVVLSGIGLLIAWQVRYPLLDSLNRCPVRRNRLPLFFPFLQLFVWLALVWLLGLILDKLFSSSPKETLQFLQHAALTVVEMLMTVFFVLVAQLAFVRGLKGFGLRLRTLGRDLFWAGVNLIAIYPVILFVLWMTIQTGQWLVGPEFGLEKHKTLEELQQASTMVKCLLVVSTLVVVPIFEELLFRGLIQSVLTAHLTHRWLAIVITSVMFASMHPGTHFLGIFALSICLGYAYEKSGSLLRSILIHIYFNAVSVLAVLFEVTQ